MQHNLLVQQHSYTATNQVEILAPHREGERKANQVESSVGVCLCVFVLAPVLLFPCARGVDSIYNLRELNGES